MPIVLDLTGTNGNQASCPDSAALSFTGDIDLRVKFALEDVTPASQMTLVAVWGTSNQYRYSFEYGADGALVFRWSANGSAQAGVKTSSTQAFFDGVVAPKEPNWVRVTFDVDNGASGNTATFYTSRDGTTWTQLGTAQTDSGTTSLFDSSASTTVGNRDDGNLPFDGQMWEVQIYEGIAGTLRANPKFHDGTQGWILGDDAGDTGSDGTNTWTLAGTATITEPESNVQGVRVLLQAAMGSNPFSSAVTWADLTDDMRSVSFARGRQYELDRVQAGTMTVTLSNASGQYNPHNTAGAYYPNIKPMVPIRLRAVYDGQVYPLWQGFVERWPASFPAQVDSVVTVQCADLFKLLALADAAQNDRTTTVDGLSPVAWWRFADDTDETGTGHTLTFAGSPTEGGATSVPWEGDVATTFDGSDDEATVASDVDVELQSADRSYEFWVRPTGNDTDYLLHIGSSTTVTSIVVAWLGATETWRIITNAGASVLDVPSEDDVWQHLVITDDITAGTYTRKAYLNGVLAGTTTAPDSTGTFTVYIGSQNGAGARFAGDISEIAVYDSVLTAQQVQSLYAAQVEAYAVERTDERIAYVLSDSAIGLGAEWVFTDLEQGQTTMSGINSPTDVTALEAIQVAADTEFGQFFMTADGYARFHDRYYRLLNQSTPVATFDSADYRNVVLGFDDELIANDIHITTSSGAVPFTAQDQTSIDSYGRRSLSRSIYPNDENEGYDFANYLKQLYAEPDTRIESIEFRIGGDPALIGTILGAELGNRYNIEVPLAGDDLDEDVFLEAVTHTISAMKVWDVTFQLSPAVSHTFWTLGVAGSSELDETTVLAY